MTANSPYRLIGTATGIILSFGAACRLQAAESSSAPVLGVVHQTEIRIAPETSARLVSFRVGPGQEVHKGDTLAVLSSPELAAALQEAKANAAAARADKANVDAGVRKEEVDIAAQNVRIGQANLILAQQQHTRAATLAARDFASKQQLDEATAALSKAEASLSLAQANFAQSQAGPTREERAIADAKVVLADATRADLEAKLAKTTLSAPVDGVVGLLVAEPGEAISPGQAVMTLQVARQRWFTFTVREDRLAGIGVGSPLTLLTAKDERIETQVSELRPLGEFAVWRAARAVGDHDINSFLLRADPTGDVGDLEPGMSVWIDRGPGAHP
ncbi:MAG: biotin/lipoyl-binding protein [Hyphomicrobiales bacterium]|nr:biotin/lipoyl-binding protein [Hyphomicrobiales bacterium]